MNFKRFKKCGFSIARGINQAIYLKIMPHQNKQFNDVK